MCLRYCWGLRGTGRSSSSRSDNVTQNLPRVPWLRAAQAPQLQALLERASDADLLKALAKAPEKGCKKRGLGPDTGALRALLERIEKAGLPFILGACTSDFHACPSW